MHSSRFIVLLGLFISSVASANAQSITFDDVPLGSTFVSYTKFAVTFTGEGGHDLLVDNGAPSNSNSLLAPISGTRSFAPVRATVAGGASFVAIDLGDNGNDLDLLFLEGYDGSGNQVASTTLLIDDKTREMKTLSLGGQTFSYVIFGSRDPSIGGSSVFADNFVYRPALGVPEPGLASLFVSGAIALGYWRRKRPA